LKKEKHAVKKIIIPLCILVFMMGTRASLCAAQPGKGEQSAEQVGQNVYSGHPEKNFIAAQADFLNKEYKKAAVEIRKGSEFLKKKTDQAEIETNKELRKSALELDALAENVEKGAVKSEKTLKDSFAKAHYTLAKYYNEKASASYAKKEYKKAGYELKASAIYLKNGMTWAGQKIEERTESVMNESHRLGDKIIQGSNWTADEFEKGLSYLGDEISALGKNIKGTKE
jgi:hypothetical protein